jgi:hypothetical protein
VELRARAPIRAVAGELRVEVRGPVPGLASARGRAGARASGRFSSAGGVGRAGSGGGGGISAGRWVFRLARSASCQLVCAKDRTPLPLEIPPPPPPDRAAAAAGRLSPRAAASVRGSSPAARAEPASSRAELPRLHAAARRRRAPAAAQVPSAASAAAATPATHRRRAQLPSKPHPTERAIPCPFKPPAPESLPPTSAQRISSARSLCPSIEPLTTVFGGQSSNRANRGLSRRRKGRGLPRRSLAKRAPQSGSCREAARDW